jgi:hypothetical protein
MEGDKKFNQIVCASLKDNGYAAKGCANPRKAYDLMYNMVLRVGALLHRANIANERRLKAGAFVMDVYVTKLWDKFSCCEDFKWVGVSRRWVPESCAIHSTHCRA